MKSWILRIKQNHKIQKKKQEKEDILKNLYVFVDDRESILDAFKSKIFPIKNKGTGILNFDDCKLLIPKQMPQRFPIALAQVKAGNNSENVLNGIWQIVYSLYQSKKRIQ